MTDLAGQTLPVLDDLNRFFWTGGQDGVLRFQRCSHCGHYQHPPSVSCSRCLSEELKPEAVAGEATIEAVTINYQPWTATMEVPFNIVIVSFAEQEGLRLTSNVIGVDPQSLQIGQRVRVAFQQIEDIWLPLFMPA